METFMDIQKSNTGSGIIATARSGTLDDCVEHLLSLVSDFFSSQGSIMLGPEKGKDGSDWYSVIIPKRMPDYRLVQEQGTDSLQVRYEQTSPPLVEHIGYVKMKAADRSRHSKVKPGADYPVQRTLYNLMEIQMYFKNKWRKDDHGRRDSFIDYIRSYSP